MKFHYSTRKIIQAAGVLLRFESTHAMDYFRLLKLLYIADRESLKETGRPIIGQTPVAMKYGPLHSEVYDLIKGQHIDEPQWAKFFQTDGYRIELKEQPGIDTLSRYEIRKLNEVSQRYANLGDWELANLTHDFPEWKGRVVPGTSQPIPLEDILEAVGRAEDIEEILQDAKEKAIYDRFFAGAPG